MSKINGMATTWDGQKPMPAFMAIMTRWGKCRKWFLNDKHQSALLGITEEALSKVISQPEVTLSQDVQQSIVRFISIANALNRLFNHAKFEADWMLSRNPALEELRIIVGNDSVANFMISNGLNGFDKITTYLEDTLTRVNNNDRYLLCLGVCNTLIDIPKMFTDPSHEVLALCELAHKDPIAIIRHAEDVAPPLENAIPLSKNILMMKRPHLNALVDYIKQKSNLDVAIITSATKEYVDNVIGMAVPELLSLCTFVWTREDRNRFLMNVTANDFYKTLQNIPELMGYQLGRIMMIEHGEVCPSELHLKITPFFFFPEIPEQQPNENSINDIIIRLETLLKAENILELRRQEHEW